MADLQFELGKMGVAVSMEGVKVDAANVLAQLNDNAEASAYIWNTIFGDNVSPGEWINRWTNNWNQQA